MNHYSGKCHDTLTMADLSFTKSTVIATAQISARENDDTDASLTFSSCTSLWNSEGFVN